jgi:hypothetical protein
MIAIPTHTRISSEGWACEFVKHVLSKRGLPKKIISDRGPQFVSKFIVDLYRLLGIQGNPSTAYHPQTDGQTEHLNQEIEQFLRIYVNYQQNNWAEWLAIATFNYNDKIHSSTGQSPFFLNHGYHPRKGIEPGKVQNLGAKEFVDRLEEARNNARKALEKMSEQMKQAYDSHRSEAWEYAVGDRVWLDAKNIPTRRPSKKLDDKRLGPFKVLSKVGSSSYRIKLPDQ